MIFVSDRAHISEICETKYPVAEPSSGKEVPVGLQEGDPAPRGAIFPILPHPEVRDQAALRPVVQCQRFRNLLQGNDTSMHNMTPFDNDRRVTIVQYLQKL